MDNTPKDKLGRNKRPTRFTVTLNFKVTPEAKQVLLEMAAKHNTNYTSICRAAVMREIAVYEAEKN